MNYSRRTFLTTASAFSVGLGAGCASAFENALTSSDLVKRKNVLFLAIDDLRPTLGVDGDKLVKTPNIDRFAERGLVFERAYVQQAVCGASRASLLTGLRPDSTGIHDYFGRVSEYVPDAVTLNEQFTRSGYKSVAIGKVYHELGDNPEGWSERHYDTIEYQRGRRKQSASVDGYLSLVFSDSKPGVQGRLPMPYEAPDVGESAYPDGQNTIFAMQEMARFNQLGVPFFIGLGLRKPHLPFFAPKKYWDLYYRSDFELPASRTSPDGAPGYAKSNWEELRAYTGMPKGVDSMPDDEALSLIHGYHACISYMDANVGKVLNQLDELGLTDNTIVVFWGYHGWKLGELGAWSKHTYFEFDVIVPLIFAGPCVSAGRCSAFVEAVDIYPTLMEMAGLAAPKNLEGMSFVPLLEDPEQAWKPAAFSQYTRNGTEKGDLVGYSMKTEQFRYIVCVYKSDGQIVDGELYDHAVDPNETVNVIHQAQYQDDIIRLEAMRTHGWQGMQQDIASTQTQSTQNSFIQE